ncbi:OmpA family protein [Pseudaestuariivita rosea]|uniref:OmpA family protein n=1 Tax=Pseudaestuariivita rosea TaxID=2763263 RepID=UPI001ABA3D7D|nr:OmpA family protein [Pseudaestuariivita rosea]
MIRSVLLCLSLSAAPALSASLQLPSTASMVIENTEAFASYAMPVGPYLNSSIPMQELEGEVYRQVWQVATGGLTTLQLLIPLRAQLLEDGFEILYSCDAEDCGGFDFRYAMDVVPEPYMHVDLGDYRYMAVARGGDSPEHLAVLVSRSPTTGFIQIVQVIPPGSDRTLETTIQPDPDAPIDPVDATSDIGDGPVAEILESRGRIVLFDLSFETGSSDLGDLNFPSLGAIADYLRTNPGRKIALVGHTDSQGNLDNNIALSRQRAASVLERLVDRHGVPRDQMEAQGMGYLAPIATNLSEAGRRLNRRVEVIITSIE